MASCTAFMAPPWPTSFRPLPLTEHKYRLKRPRAPLCPTQPATLSRRLPSSCTPRPRIEPPFARSNDFDNKSSLTSSASPSEENDSSLPASSHTPPLTDSSPAPAPANQSIPISIGPISFTITSRALLYVVPLLWGSFAPAVRFLFAQHPQQPAAMFNSERLLLSTLIYLPILLKEFVSFRDATPEVRKGDRFSFFRAGLELGVYVFLANIAQVIGLKQTSASRAAFLVQLQTVFVPVLGTFLGVDSINLLNGMSSVVAVAGVALLSSDKSSGADSSLTGDALEILSAIFFSAYVVRLGKFCKDGVAGNALVAVKIATQALFSIGWAIQVELSELTSHGPAHVNTSGDTDYSWTTAVVAINIGVVLWTGLLSSAASGWAQTKGQQSATPSEAVLIFATQPLWATALAAALLGESFGPRGFAGGLLIVGATLIPTLAAKLGYTAADPKQSGKEKDGR